jgi:transcriptional regulator with XRE-family HTH domain
LIVLGEAVRGIRTQRHFSASELARASGVPLRRLAALEDGWLDPDIELLHKLAKSMGIRRAAFFRRAEELDADVGEES